jgi:hypothetical protein
MLNDEAAGCKEKDVLNTKQSPSSKGDDVCDKGLPVVFEGLLS